MVLIVCFFSGGLSIAFENPFSAGAALLLSNGYFKEYTDTESYYRRQLEPCIIPFLLTSHAQVDTVVYQNRGRSGFKQERSTTAAARGSKQWVYRLLIVAESPCLGSDGSDG